MSYNIRLLVSRYDYCLMDPLWRWDACEFDARIPLIASNHTDLRSRAELYGIPFYPLSIDKRNKVKQESEILDLLASYEKDVLVLTRYEQILTPEFANAYPDCIISIHHSFLPAFVEAPLAIGPTSGV